MELIINGNELESYAQIYLYIKQELTNNTDEENLKISELLEKYIISKNIELNVIWNNSEKSREILGYIETIKHLKKQLQNVPLYELVQTLHELKTAEKNEGEILFDKIVNTFKDNGISVTLN